jgi:hypothetical protein
MASPFTLASLGASLLVGVATGIHLGESAVGMIDPVHFRGPALHPRDRGAAIDEQARLVPQPVPPQPYGWEEGYAARAAACGDCDVWEPRQTEDYSAVVPYFGADDAPAGPEVANEAGRADRGREPADLYADGGESPGQKIEPYVHFPLGYEERAFGAPLAEPKPADEDFRPRDDFRSEFRSEDVYRH